MHRVLLFGFVALVCAQHALPGLAQDSTPEQLRQQIELLELKLQLVQLEADRLEAECERLRKENARLKGDAKDGDEATDDPFQPGTVWAGEAINNDKIKTQWALSISERNGRNFKGAIAAINSDGKKLELPVSGKAPDRGSGLVEFESPVMGRAKMFMRGTLRNGSIALAFSGTTPLGQKFFGSATLRPKQ
jgi:septal ring factor EnvC (AmiA/AmiB activator)